LLPVAQPPTWRIPLRGPLFEGHCVRVGWPEPDEIDSLTTLRNRPQVRVKFLDPRPLDPQCNREWIEHGMRRPYEALLAIRLKRGGALVGAIGWSRGDPGEGSFELGRVMIDAAVLRRYRRNFPPSYAGVATDAGTALRDFGFRTLGLTVMRSVFIDDNRLSRRALLLGGGCIVGGWRMQRADGTEVAVTRAELRREEWEGLVDGGKTFSGNARRRQADG
jgi:RimJ/RimL family protein N-acetyltransferase